MKILKSIYALLALILVSMTFSKIRNSRSKECKCNPTEFCINNKCHPRIKKGGLCPGEGAPNCELATKCKENPKTHKWECLSY